MPLSRRALLTSLAIGLPAALATALMPRLGEHREGELAATSPSGPPAVPPPPARPSGLPPVHSGTVVSIFSNILRLQEANTGETVEVHLTPHTARDNGLWVAELPIEVGDRVYVRGTRSGSAVVAETLEVNPRFWYGPVLEVLQPQAREISRFRLRDRYDLSPWHTQQPEGHLVVVDPRTLVTGPVNPPTGNAAGYRPPQGLAKDVPFRLAEGQVVEVSGREYRGVLFAVRIGL